MTMLFCINSASQNLILDPSFELYSQCPKKIKHKVLETLKYWKQTNTGSPDYFNSCSRKQCGVPYNKTGCQDALYGHGYLGLILYDNSNTDYREYIYQELKTHLVKGKEYYIEYYVSLGDKSYYGANNLGMAFSDTIYEVYNTSLLNIYKPFYECPEIIFDKQNWIKVSSRYIANGNEKYLIIGNFKSNIDTKHKADMVIKKNDFGAYYYIENVYLTKIPKSFDVHSSDSIKINGGLYPLVFKAPIRINLLLSKPDISEVLGVLKELHNFMKKNPLLKIIINVENVGKEGSNLYKSIMNYLIETGISETRVLNNSLIKTTQLIEVNLISRSWK